MLVGCKKERYTVLSNNSDSRPSNFLFQIARGSEATLSECTFFFEKNARHQGDFFKTDHFKTSRQKEPEQNYIRVLFDKEPGYMLGSPSTKNRNNFKTRPSRSLYQIARGLGPHPKGSTFFFKKVHTTRRSHKALHGFAQESTRMTLVPARQDLKEQDKASRTQP